MSALVLAPSALAASRAARRLCDAQGGVLFGAEVATLDRLVPALLAAAGDPRAVLTPLAERLVAVDAGRDAGGPFAGLAPESGLAAALSRSIAELRRGGVRPAHLRAAAADVTRAAAARLLALAAALEAYEARLAAREALDRAAATGAAAAAARRGAGIAGDVDLLVVAGIAAVSDAEWDLLAALAARAKRVRFHLPFFPERPDACAPAEPLLRRVESLHELAARAEVEVVLGRVDGDGRLEGSAALLRAFAGGRGGPAPGGGAPSSSRPSAATLGTGVIAEAGAGEAGEADAAARVLARLLEGGLAPDDVAVVAAAPRRAGPALARACAARGVPLAVGRGPALADAPPVRAVLDALAASAAPSRAAVERLAASTYLAPAGLDATLAGLLDRAGAIDGRLPPAEAIRRRAALLSGARSARERAALARAAAGLDALAASLRPLAAPGAVRDHARRLTGFLDASGLRRRAARGPAAVVARDLAALARLEEAADALARAVALAGAGERALDAERFAALLGLAIDEAALPPAGDPAAGAVELSALDEATALSARAAVLMGCDEGAWPPAPAPEPLLRDGERVALARVTGRLAVPTAAARRAEARHRAFCAAAAGREVVAFTWAAPGPDGAGGPLAPIVADALAAIGVTPAPPAPEPRLAAARTPREALRAAARAGAAGAAALAGTTLGGRAATAAAAGAIERTRRVALDARRAAPHAGAVRGAAASALAAALPAEWSPTQLETYARCPFRLLLQLARLPDPAARDLDQDGRDEGSLLHAILERLVAARVRRGAWPMDGGPADAREARAAAEDVFRAFEAEGRTGDPAVWTARREAVLARVERIVRAEARDHDGLSPALVEHRFGGGSDAPPVALAANGETVLLQGRIDRVDASGERLRVIDYKNAKAATAFAALLDPEQLGRTSFQVPAYLLAAARALPGRPTLEATYALLRKAARVEPLALSAADPLLAAAPGAAAGDGDTFAERVVSLVGRIRAGDFPIAPRSCENCAFGAVCRSEGATADDEGGGAP